MTALGTSLLLFALVPAAAPEAPKPIDYEKQLNDKLGAGIKPEENANALLFLAFGPKPEGSNMPADYYKRLGIAEPPEKGDYFVGIGKFVSDHLQLDREEFDDVFNQQSWSSSRPWVAKERPFIAAWLKHNEKPMAVVSQAVKRPKYYNPLVSRKTDKDPGSLIGVLLPSVQKCRELAAAFSARAMLRLQEGKIEEAWADLQTCHRLGRHVANGGTLIEGLVGIAIDAIASNADLAFLENAALDTNQTLTKLKDLQALPPFPDVASKIDLAERATFHDSLGLVRRGGVRMLEGLAGDRLGLKPTEEDLKALSSLDWSPAIANGDKWYDRMTAALKKPNRAERKRELLAIEAEFKALKDATKNDPERLAALLKDKDAGKVVTKMISDILLLLLMPAIEKVQDSRDRQETIQSNLQVAFALVAYQREHGKYPAKLDDLAPKYLAKIPGDVFSGKALNYIPDAKGFLLFSVGVNGMDDGGRWYDDEPRGDDPRVRLPLPELKKD